MAAASALQLEVKVNEWTNEEAATGDDKRWTSPNYDGNC